MTQNPPQRPPLVTIIPSPPSFGTWTSAIVYDLFGMLGALRSGMPGITLK
jgi:hypothetical protein